MQIAYQPRKSSVLSSSSLACLADVASVNLTSSCAHGCIYCYACGYSSRPAEGKIVVYSNLFEKLKGELARKRKMPKTIYFSPSSDLFQPIPEVLQMGYNIIEFLLEQKLNVAFVTKGAIPESHFALFQIYPAQIQAQVGLISTDADVLTQFEPNAAPPKLRLEQIRRLTESGIATSVRLDPIIPDVTDDDETFTNICDAIASIGVKKIAASVLFLRPAIKESLQRNISDPKVLQKILDRFSKAKRLAIHAERSVTSAISCEEREAIFHRLYNIAEGFGIGLHVCGCKNPDIPVGLFSKDCRLSGSWNQMKTQNDLLD
jgi:DNA repair photolyase